VNIGELFELLGKATKKERFFRVNRHPYDHKLNVIAEPRHDDIIWRAPIERDGAVRCFCCAYPLTEVKGIFRCFGCGQPFIPTELGASDA